MELKIILQVILLVNLSTSRDVFDTEDARKEWQLLSHSGNYSLLTWNLQLFHFKFSKVYNIFLAPEVSL